MTEAGEIYRGAEDSPFPAKLTAVAVVNGVNLYSWTEQGINTTTGASVDANPPRSGNASTSPARDPNNAILPIPSFCYLKRRADVLGKPVFDIIDAAPSGLSIVVKQATLTPLFTSFTVSSAQNNTLFECYADLADNLNLAAELPPVSPGGGLPNLPAGWTCYFRAGNANNGDARGPTLRIDPNGTANADPDSAIDGGTVLLNVTGAMAQLTYLGDVADGAGHVGALWSCRYIPATIAAHPFPNIFDPPTVQAIELPYIRLRSVDSASYVDIYFQSAGTGEPQFLIELWDGRTGTPVRLAHFTLACPFSGGFVNPAISLVNDATGDDCLYTTGGTGTTKYTFESLITVLKAGSVIPA